MALAGIGTVIEVGGLLWKVFNRSRAKVQTTSSTTGNVSSAIEATLQTVHESPDVAIVDVKSSWFNVDNLTRLVAFIATGLALVFGHDVVTSQVQGYIVGLIAAALPLYEWWRSRRRTSITKAAAVNVLQKPAK